MSGIHIQTGNRLDVVVGDEGDLHLQFWGAGGILIPLPDPRGLIAVLESELERLEQQKRLKEIT